MKKLKNWTITSKSVKNGLQGYLNYTNYLMNESKHKDETISNLSSDNAIKNMAYVAERFNLRRKLSKGGRPSNVAWSSVLSYPFEINDDDFLSLTDEILSEFFQYVSDTNDLNLDEKEIKSLIKNQTVKIVHRGKHNHIHLLIPKHFNKTKKSLLKTTKEVVSIDLSKKKYLHRLKVINDNVVDSKLGISKVDYQIKAHQEQKKRLTKSNLERERISVLRAELEALRDAIQFRLEEELYKDELEDNLTLINRAVKQLDNENTNRAERTINKIKRNMSPGM